ncbi:MAG: hypothetical protein B6I19_00895 [Bacteroidetes bacterium 4572_114]|nr:MAG: hypothetical protein B6I19_00895 [Bacteroidetes bacterium 4572_114]
MCKLFNEYFWQIMTLLIVKTKILELQTMRIENLLWILLLLFCTISCVDKYMPELDKYENLLVVDGLLTNGSDPIVVRLSIASPVNNEKFIPVGGGGLFITDDNQVMVQHLLETVPGTYKAADTSFRGQVGKGYQLHINLPNGQSYISDVCRLNAPAPIDSVFGILESPDNSENDNDFPGIQFYVENHSEVNDSCYYLWRLSETYKYRSDFDIDYTWEGEFIPYPDPDSLRTCWRTTKVDEILFASTKYLGPTAINQFPLHFVSTATKRLSIKYSVLVKQLSISEGTFNFYNAIKEQNIEQGDMWAQQPFQILGNMHDANNPDKPVLGYFIVAGTTEKRIFVDRPPLEFYYDICPPDFDLRFIEFEPEGSWPIYIDDIMFLGWAMADERVCFDCRLEGGSLSAPEFWE